MLIGGVAGSTGFEPPEKSLRRSSHVFLVIKSLDEISKIGGEETDKERVYVYL